MCKLIQTFEQKNTVSTMNVNVRAICQQWWIWNGKLKSYDYAQTKQFGILSIIASYRCRGDII